MTLLATLTLATPAAHADPPKTSAAFYSSRCADAWSAVRWYRGKYDQHRASMGQTLAPPVEQAMNCRRLRERARYWRQAAKVNRLAAARWGRTIHNRPDWKRAALEVQKAFPGTYGWLMSCSSAEGGHGRWVWYGGGSWNGYHIGGDTVGGQMQFRFSTFAPYYRHATHDLKRRGFRVPYLGSGYEPWLSPLGQALTAGYMRYYGKDGHHWSASHSNGC